MLMLPQQISLSLIGSDTILFAVGERLLLQIKLPSFRTRIGDEGSGIWHFIVSSMSVWRIEVDAEFIILRDSKITNSLRTIPHNVWVNNAESFEKILVVCGESNQGVSIDQFEHFIFFNDIFNI